MSEGSIGERPPEEGETSMGEGDVKVLFVKAPSAEDLKPTLEERRVLQDLREWQEKSAQSHWVLGQPTYR